MIFTNRLIKGKLIKRYKRFFTDIKVNKEIITAHCPNTGSMLGLLNEDNEVWVSKNDDPKRKLKYTLEIIKVKNILVGVNTHLANKIVLEGLSNNYLKEFNNLDKVKPEVFYNKETRFDFLIKKKNRECFIEVKNVTLFRNGMVAEFPDSPTTRGSKHLITLIDAKNKGFKSYVIFLVQIEKMTKFKIARDLDKNYYNNYLLAKKSGVQFLAYRCKIDPKEIKIERKLEIIDE
jgi:sugar fermentation stimulation protein A